MANSHLKVVGYLDREMESEDVEALYFDDLSSELLQAAKAHLVGRTVRICIVEGEDAIEALQDLAGRHFDSAKCSEGSIRREFAVHGDIQYGSVTYFLNAIHKASRSEVQLALAWYAKVQKEDPGT